MSASRIGGAEGMDVEETEVALPTREWMEAAQKENKMLLLAIRYNVGCA